MALVRHVSGGYLESPVSQLQALCLVGHERSDLAIETFQTPEDGFSVPGVGSHDDQWHDPESNVGRGQIQPVPSPFY